MSIHSHSQIWGEGKNPKDHNRTPGGSSGGDGGLVGSGSSPFALGVDFAGSIRIPSFFNGIVGFLPTADRHSTQGISCYTKYDSVHSKIWRPCIGPMTRNIDDMIEIMKVLDPGKARKYDKLVPDQPFDSELFEYTLQKNNLRIGVIKNIDELVALEKDSLNAFEDAKEAFKRGGHEIVEFEIKDILEFVMNGINILNNEGFPLILDEMMEKGDPLQPNIQIFLFMFNILPKFVKTILGFIARLCLPRIFSDILYSLHPTNTEGLFKMTTDRNQKIQDITDQYHELKLDGILAPGYHTVPFELSEKANHDMPPLHIMLFNILHFPVGAGKEFSLLIYFSTSPLKE